VKTNLIKRRINRRKTAAAAATGWLLKSVKIDELSVVTLKHRGGPGPDQPNPLQPATSRHPAASEACNIGANKAANCRSEAAPAAAFSLQRSRPAAARLGAVKWTSLAARCRCLSAGDLISDNDERFLQRSMLHDRTSENESGISVQSLKNVQND